MIVKVKKLNDKAQIPEQAYNGDFCYDVYATSEEEIAPNVWKYGLGIALQIERGRELIAEEIHQSYEDGYCKVVRQTSLDFANSPLKLDIDIRSRSSVYKTGMVLSNCEGTVDEGYTNEISAIFYHLFPSMPRYKVGDKIGQMKIGITFPIEFINVEELDDTERGLKGYGSSDNKNNNYVR